MKTKLKLFGYSDDCIEIENAKTQQPVDEISAIEKRFLLFSDGSVISGEFDKEGVWRFEIVKHGSAQIGHNKFEGEPDYEADDAASDVMELEAEGLELLWHGDDAPPEAGKSCLALAAKIIKSLSQDGNDLDDVEALENVCEVLGAEIEWEDEQEDPREPCAADGG